MGESRRRQQALTAQLAQAQAAAEIVGPAIRKLAEAASSRLGSDCITHAELSRLALAELGVATELVVGCAAWRVGPGDGDVIAHVFQVKGYLPPGAEQGFPYHAWLRLGDVLIDLTTYQLRLKAAALDSHDGGHTLVQWCPDHLVVPVSEVSSYQAVAQALTAGIFYYEFVPQLHARVTASMSVDTEDLQLLKIIMANPDIIVQGPNNRADPEQGRA